MDAGENSLTEAGHAPYTAEASERIPRKARHPRRGGPQNQVRRPGLLRGVRPLSRGGGRGAGRPDPRAGRRRHPQRQLHPRAEAGGEGPGAAARDHERLALRQGFAHRCTRRTSATTSRSPITRGRASRRKYLDIDVSVITAAPWTRTAISTSAWRTPSPGRTCPSRKPSSSR